jgi:hypothetical protein
VVDVVGAPDRAETLDAAARVGRDARSIARARAA